MSKHAIFRNSIILLFCILLNSCTKNIDITTIQVSEIRQLSENHSDINNLWQNVMLEEDHTLKADYLLQLCNLLIQEGNNKLAITILKEFPKDLPSSLMYTQSLLLTHAYLMNKSIANASKYLDKVDLLQLSINQSIFYLKLQSAIRAAKEDWLRASSALIEIERRFSIVNNSFNKGEIFYFLAKTPKIKLSTTSIETNDNYLREWLSIANLYQKFYQNPEELLRQVVLWKNNSSLSLSSIVSDDIKRELLVNNRPTKIALFLPLSGPLKQVGEAIREGFMSAVFSYTGNLTYQTNFYDTSSNNSIQQLYKKAIAEGNDFIIGPVTKQDVLEMYEINKSTKNIVLNYVPNQANHITQLAINLTQEAEYVAYKAFNDNHRNAIVIFEDSNWGKSITDSFSEAWEKLGGYNINQIPISANTNPNAAIIDMLGIKASQNRFKSIRNILPGTKFFPTVSDSIDVIFLAIKPSSARQIIPLIKFNYAGKIALYGTSAIYNGTPDTNRDKDLNGVIFCDMPSTLNLSARKKYNKWDENLSSQERLSSIGHDAFWLMAHQPLLQHTNLIGLPLKTGHIYLDQKNKIIRKLEWAKFSHGKPTKYY